MVSLVPSTERATSGLVPSTEPVPFGLVPSTEPIDDVQPQSSGIVPSTKPAAPAAPSPTAVIDLPTQRSVEGASTGVWSQKIADRDSAVWPPLGRQPDGTFVWQYGPQWLKTLWGIKD